MGGWLGASLCRYLMRDGVLVLSWCRSWWTPFRPWRLSCWYRLLSFPCLCLVSFSSFLEPSLKRSVEMTCWIAECVAVRDFGVYFYHQWLCTRNCHWIFACI